MHRHPAVYCLWAVVFVIVLLSATAVALAVSVEELENQQRRSEESDKTQDALEQARTHVDRMERLLNRIGRTKELKCLKAFGHSRFCKCIAQKTPVVF
jgi:type II secretory pathway component PulJ